MSVCENGRAVADGTNGRSGAERSLLIGKESTSTSRDGGEDGDEDGDERILMLSGSALGVGTKESGEGWKRRSFARRARGGLECSRPMMDVWSGLAGWQPGYPGRQGAAIRSRVRFLVGRPLGGCWCGRWWCLLPCRFVVGGGRLGTQVQVQDQVQIQARAQAGVADGWGRKRAGELWTDGPSALNRIKWQPDETLKS